jgi:hypothetical protein
MVTARSATSSPSVTPGVDELVELAVNRSELAALDVPVRLLADQGQVDQVNEHPLKLAGNRPFVAAEWNMELVCGR